VVALRPHFNEHHLRIRQNTAGTRDVRSPDAAQRTRVRACAARGIHWGQFPELFEWSNLDKVDEARRDHLITQGGYVKGMSGMTCVIPAWQVLEVLDTAIEKNPLSPEQQRSNDAQAVAESVLPTKGENLAHREDFVGLLNKAAKPPKAE
jgi:hypothetical protein